MKIQIDLAHVVGISLDGREGQMESVLLYSEHSIRVLTFAGVTHA